MSINLNVDITESLKRERFAVVTSDSFDMKGLYNDFVDLTNSFLSMKKDNYFGNEKKATRYRRYSDFSFNPIDKELSLLEHKPYYQSQKHNSYVGGEVRHFEDFNQEILESDFVKKLVINDFDIYAKTLPKEVLNLEWQCQIHQIRIEIKPNQTVEITPELIHCDGYPFSGVHFWGKNNIDGADSKLYLKDETEICSGRLENILDTVYFYDRELLHYVTPATNTSSSEMAYRQILAISFSLPNSKYNIVD